MNRFHGSDRFRTGSGTGHFNRFYGSAPFRAEPGTVMPREPLERPERFRRDRSPERAGQIHHQTREEHP